MQNYFKIALVVIINEIIYGLGVTIYSAIYGRMGENAVAAMRAINAMSLANFLSGSRKISLDLVIKTMYETGKDLSHLYRETSAGGLAKLYTGKE